MPITLNGTTGITDADGGQIKEDQILFSVRES